MAWDNLSVSLRNDTGSPIALGTLSIAAAGSEPIWDTVSYTAGVIDNFAEVLSGIATFNEEIQGSNLVMVVNTVDQSVSEAFAQFAELTDVYNELEEARSEFSRLRLEGESTLGLDLVTTSGIDLDSDAALLPGRSGGQTLIGGTAAGEDLVLQSTSNATRGNVLVRDDELRIFDDADPTKLLAFQLSGLTASTTRTVTMADADVNLADIALNNAHRGSTSNPHSTTLANLTDTDLTGIVQGSVLYRNATQWVVLTPGTAGQFLRTGGAGANPSWASGLALTSTAPVDVTKATAVVGVGTTAARHDHKHNISTAAAVAVGTTNAEGNSTSLARANHTHQVTGLAIAGAAQGDILYRNATAWVRLPAGTAGQVLTTQGAGANPSWATASGTGDVVGPASATDYAVALFNGATGKLLRNSTLLSDANGNLFLNANGSTPASPRILGFSNFSAGEAYRWQNTTNDGIQSQFDGAVTYYSYNTMVFRGNRNDVLPAFDADAGVSYLFESGQAGEPNMVVRGADSQTADLQQWVDDPTSDTVVGYVGPAGDFGGRTFQLSLIDDDAESSSEGLLTYDSARHTLVVHSDNDERLWVGLESHLRVVNNTGSALSAGAAVYINGASGGLPTVTLAQANTVATAYAVGLVDEAIANGAEGIVTTSGLAEEVDTSTFSPGDTLYVSPTTPGALTATPPTAGDIRVEVCRVLTSGVLGHVFVKPHGLPLSADKSLNVPGDFYVSADGSTLANPRIIGASDMTSGEGARYQFGDAANGWQNGYDQAMQMWAYHTIILEGDRSSGTPPSMETTSNIGVLVRNTTASSPALVVQGASSQSGALQEWRNSASTVLAFIDAAGNFDLNAHHLDDVATANYDSWPTGSSGSAFSVLFDEYQARTLTLNAANVAITLNTPRGPGAYKLVLIQDGTGGRNVTWAAEGGATIYAAGGTSGIAPDTNANTRTLYGLIYDGSAWYVVKSGSFQSV